MELLGIINELSKVSEILRLMNYKQRSEKISDYSSDQICAIQKIVLGIASGKQIKQEIEKVKSKKNNVVLKQIAMVQKFVSNLPPKLMEETIKNRTMCIDNFIEAKENKNPKIFYQSFKLLLRNVVEYLEIKKSIFRLNNIYDAAIFDFHYNISSESIESQLYSMGSLLSQKISNGSLSVQKQVKTKKIDKQKLMEKLISIKDLLIKGKDLKITISFGHQTTSYHGANLSKITINPEEIGSSLSAIKYTVEQVGNAISKSSSVESKLSAITNSRRPNNYMGKYLSNLLSLDKQFYTTFIDVGQKLTASEMKKNIKIENIYYNGLFSENPISDIIHSMMLYAIEKNILTGKVGVDGIQEMLSEGIERFFPSVHKDIDMAIFENFPWFYGNFGRPAISLVNNITALNEIIRKTQKKENFDLKDLESCEKSKNLLHKILTKKDSFKSILEEYIDLKTK